MPRTLALEFRSPRVPRLRHTSPIGRHDGEEVSRTPTSGAGSTGGWSRQLRP
jgi:hypothetical protein